MKTVKESNINELVTKLSELIECTTNSIDDYYSSGKKINDHEVDDWNKRLLKNLKNYKSELENAISEYKNGDSEPLQGIASMVSSIERNIDNFSNDWMTTDDKNIFNKTLDATSNVAYEISVLLYEG